MRPPTAAAPDQSVRELLAVREVIHAFLTADRPEEVYQFALERVSPLVGATFASVYLVDGASELMRLGAAYNWPQRFRPWLGEARVRLGFGPSGEAASERRTIEVADVFADDDLEDWQEVASELGFRSLIALPLQTGSKVLGAVTFYFADAESFSSEKRGLLRIVADQMAATAEKSLLIEQLRRSNAALVEVNAELERQYAAVLQARRLKDEFLANISHELRTPLTAVLGYISILQDGISGPLTEGQRHDLTHVRRASERLLDSDREPSRADDAQARRTGRVHRGSRPARSIARRRRIVTRADAGRHDAARRADDHVAANPERPEENLPDPG